MRDLDESGGPKPLTSLSTQELILRIHKGDEPAREVLFRRYEARLKRLAHGQLPAVCRGLNDTQDVVHNTLCRALIHLDSYEHRHEGAFLAWLRRILRNEIRDQLRRAHRRPIGVPMDERLTTNGPSPAEEAIGRENMEIYESALKKLPEQHREALILRLEYGMSYVEIARAMELPSPNATRMMIQRAMVRLAQKMREMGGAP